MPEDGPVRPKLVALVFIEIQFDYVLISSQIGLTFNCTLADLKRNNLNHFNLIHINLSRKVYFGDF